MAPNMKAGRTSTRQLAIAYHEAGHAVVAWNRNIKVTSVTIVPTHDALGTLVHVDPLRGIRLDWDNSNRARLRAEAMIIVLLAGPAAQMRHRSQSYRNWHSSGDYEYALDLAMHLNGSPEAAEAYLNWLAVVARDEVESSWGRIETIVRALVDRRTLNAAEVAVCCRQAAASMNPQEGV